MADAFPIQLFNTAQDLRFFYENSVIGDYPDPNETYVLFNQVKDIIEDMLNLQIALTVDTSQTANVGDTYLSMKPLPLDFRSTEKIVLTSPSGGSLALAYYPIAMRLRDRYQKVFRRYYTDMKNKQFALTGSVGSSMTINHYYKCYTGQMSVGTETLTNPIAWPARFWNILAYGAAAIKQGNFDADAMQFRMSIEQQTMFDTLLVSLQGWDHDLKLQDMNHRGGYADDVAEDSDGMGYDGPFNNYVGLH